MNSVESASSDIIRIHCIVHGRVQGVGFRAFTQRKASENGLTGWVRNRWNGTVEVVAEGSRKTVEDFLQVLRRGPFSGTTRDVKVDWQKSRDEFNTFRIRMTG